MPCYNNMKNREDRDIISMFSSMPKLSNVRPQRYSLLKYVDLLLCWFTASTVNLICSMFQSLQVVIKWKYCNNKNCLFNI